MSESSTGCCTIGGPYKITREAIEALRFVGEGYLLEVLEEANLACMHRDRCTLSPKDVRLFRRLRGNSIGEEAESTEARKADWEKYRQGWLTIQKAMVLDTNHHQNFVLWPEEEGRELCKQLDISRLPPNWLNFVQIAFNCLFICHIAWIPPQHRAQAHTPVCCEEVIVLISCKTVFNI